MNAAGLLRHCNNKGPVRLGFPTDPVCSSGTCSPIVWDQNGTQTHGQLPYTEANDQPYEIPAWDYRNTFNLIGSHNSCRRSQSPPSSRHNVIERSSDQRSLQYTVDAAQVFSLCAEWERIFSQQPLPALVLYHAIKPCEAALSASVTQFDNTSNFQSLLYLHRILQSSCYELLDLRGTEDFRDTRLKSLGSSMDLNCDRTIVVSANGLSFDILRLKGVSDLIDPGRENRECDPRNHLASACLMVMKSVDPFRSTLFQRCVMYLAHLLRHASFSTETTQRYLDAIAETMDQSQARDTSRSIPWSTLPLVGDSLHFKPELQCYADILTFAAREALPLPLHMLPAYDESRRRFAVTAHALASWASCLPKSHPDKILEPSLQKRQEMLRCLLTYLTPPESTLYYGKYSLWKEALRLCNSGHVKEPFQLLAIFLTKSKRPDLLWEQALRPSLEMGCDASELLTVLRAETSGAVAPQLFQMVVCQVEQMGSQTDRQMRQRNQDHGDLAEWKGW